MKIITNKQAKELEIKKWKYIIKNNYNPNNFLKNKSELSELIDYCGFCELYITNCSKKFKHCYKCPLVIMTDDYNYDLYGCKQINHPFKLWFEGDKDNRFSKENAQKMLDLILNIEIK